MFYVILGTNLKTFLPDKTHNMFLLYKIYNIFIVIRGTDLETFLPDKIYSMFYCHSKLALNQYVDLLALKSICVYVAIL